MSQPIHSRKLRAHEAASYLGISSSTLAKMRLRGDGPPYSKAGRKVVLYDMADLDKWVASHQRRSTSESGGAR
jgi:predicted DNA-binding transcriptional regulator AlpA